MRILNIKYKFLSRFFPNLITSSMMVNYLKNNGQNTLLSSTMTDAVNPQKWHLKMGFIECGMLCGINEDGVGEIFFKKIL